MTKGRLFHELSEGFLHFNLTLSLLPPQPASFMLLLILGTFLLIFLEGVMSFQGTNENTDVQKTVNLSLETGKKKTWVAYLMFYKEKLHLLWYLWDVEP